MDRRQAGSYRVFSFRLETIIMEWLSEFGAIAAMQGFNGLSVFCVLLLMALGLAIIFGQMGVINMAHGEFLTFGAYTTYLISVFINDSFPALLPYYFPFAILCSFLTAFLLGLLVEFSFIRHLISARLTLCLRRGDWGLFCNSSF